VLRLVSVVSEYATSRENFLCFIASRAMYARELTTLPIRATQLPGSHTAFEAPCYQFQEKISQSTVLSTVPTCRMTVSTKPLASLTEHCAEKVARNIRTVRANLGAITLCTARVARIQGTEKARQEADTKRFKITTWGRLHPLPCTPPCWKRFW